MLTRSVSVILSFRVYSENIILSLSSASFPIANVYEIISDLLMTAGCYSNSSNKAHRRRFLSFNRIGQVAPICIPFNTRVCPLNDISTNLAVFAEFARVSNKDRHGLINTR